MRSLVDALAFLSRPRRKTIVGVTVAIWTCITLVLVFGCNDQGFEQVEGAIYEGQHDGGYAGGQVDVPTADAARAAEHERVAKTKQLLLNNLSIQLFQNKNNIKDFRNVEGHLLVYDVIFTNHDVNSVLGSLDFAQRCDLYFTTLYTQQPNWYLNPDENLPLENRDEFKYDSYRTRKTDELKEAIAKEKDIKKEDVKMDQEFEDKMKDKYKEFWAKTQRTEQTVTDYLSHLRIYNRCYVLRDNVVERQRLDAFVSKQKRFITRLTDAGASQLDASGLVGGDASEVQANTLLKASLKFRPSARERLLNYDSFASCGNIESRIYPWLLMAFPMYERWTKEITFSPPQMHKYIKLPVVFAPSHAEAHRGRGKAGKVKSKLTKDNRGCFVTHFKNLLNGKGIVLLIADKHVDEAVRQIHLLRALNNKYPIQIVYNDGLTEANKDRIIMAAREPMSLLPASFHTVEKYFAEDYLDPRDHGLPKQEVWFVNVHNSIHDKYKGKFGGFGNKFLAAMFNSFEEFMLVDHDTVVVQNPDYFFNLRNYRQKGAFFYKDRAAPQFRPEADCTFFKKITPSVLDSVMFDVPTTSRQLFDIEFFTGMFYYMESGLVMINRNLHFNAIPMMVQMNFLQTVTNRVYGDKEIFFLAFLAAGEDDFFFNEYFAASIGEETPMDERLSDEKPKLFLSRQICLAHPGHINSEDGRLLVWFNSGFRFCGQYTKVNYEKEFKEGRRYKSLSDEEQMKALYRNPLRLRHAVIPPFKNKLETWCDNKIDEPKQAWEMDGGYCNLYLWCAYDRIGGPTDKGTDSTQKGKFIEFDQKSIDLFSYYGDIWVGNE